MAVEQELGSWLALRPWVLVWVARALGVAHQRHKIRHLVAACSLYVPAISIFTGRTALSRGMYSFSPIGHDT